MHLGTIDFHDLGDRTSLVVYGTDADPALVALVIGGAAREGLAGLPALLGLDPGGAPAPDTGGAVGSRLLDAVG